MRDARRRLASAVARLERLGAVYDGPDPQTAPGHVCEKWAAVEEARAAVLERLVGASRNGSSAR